MRLDKDKPKLLFFEDDYSDVLPHFWSGHVEYVRRQLNTHFDMHLVERDSDFAELIDRVKPELVAFDGGVLHHSGRRERRIANLEGDCSVPRIGIVRTDAHDPETLKSLDRLERFGVQAYFAIDTGLWQYVSGLDDRLFYWPWSVDGNLFLDYGLEKSFAVSMTGHGYLSNGSYPWRRNVFDAVSRNFPCFVSNRPNRRSPVMLYGEAYAKLLNRSYASLGCGCHRRILVRKMLEIPACRSLLVTEDTEAARLAGFVDGENSILTNEVDIVAKLEDAFEDLDRFSSMTKAGMDLVGSRHSMQSRTQILDWLTIHCRDPNSIIGQSSPFSALKAVESSAEEGVVLKCGSDSRLVRLRTRLLKVIEEDDAEGMQEAIAEYETYSPRSMEADLARAFKCLRGSEPARAIYHLAPWLWYDFSVGTCRTPVGYSMWMIAVVSLGRIATASRMARMCSPLSRPQLQKVWRETALIAKKHGVRFPDWIPDAPIVFLGRSGFEDRFGDLVEAELLGIYRKLEGDGIAIELEPVADWALFGGGPFATRLLEESGVRKHFTTLLNNQMPQGETFCGLDVARPDLVLSKSFERIVVTNGDFNESVFQLLSMGVDPSSIHVLDREKMKMRPVCSESPLSGSE